MYRLKGYLPSVFLRRNFATLTILIKGLIRSMAIILLMAGVTLGSFPGIMIRYLEHLSAFQALLRQLSLSNGRVQINNHIRLLIYRRIYSLLPELQPQLPTLMPTLHILLLAAVFHACISNTVRSENPHISAQLWQIIICLFHEFHTELRSQVAKFQKLIFRFCFLRYLSNVAAGSSIFSATNYLVYLYRMAKFVF